jgi:hypothetical protein
MAVRSAWCNQRGPKLTFWPIAARALEEDGSQKAASSGSGLFNLQMCSAPSDVHGSKVVLYGCDGRVQAVEGLRARGFIYASN